MLASLLSYPPTHFLYDFMGGWVMNNGRGNNWGKSCVTVCLQWSMKARWKGCARLYSGVFNLAIDRTVVVLTAELDQERDNFNQISSTVSLWSSTPPMDSHNGKGIIVDRVSGQQSTKLQLMAMISSRTLCCSMPRTIIFCHCNTAIRHVLRANKYSSWRDANRKIAKDEKNFFQKKILFLKQSDIYTLFHIWFFIRSTNHSHWNRFNLNDVHVYWW